MGAFRRNDRDENEKANTYPVTRSDVVPALRSRHGLPTLWGDSGDDEVTGETARFPSSRRSKGNPQWADPGRPDGGPQPERGAQLTARVSRASPRGASRARSRWGAIACPRNEGPPNECRAVTGTLT